VVGVCYHRVDAEVLPDDPLDAHQPSDYFPDSHTDLAPRFPSASRRVSRRCAHAQPKRLRDESPSHAHPRSCQKSPLSLLRVTVGDRTTPFTIRVAVRGFPRRSMRRPGK
jgi:hypothetical protein